MYSIKEYDIFVFDFDGTVMDTEFYHYIAWKNVLKKEISNFDLLEDDYFRMNHNLETSTFRNFLKDTYELHDYDRLYTLKGIEYKRLINQNYVLYMNSITSFFTHIKNNKKIIIMVTNSSKSTIEWFINNYPDLNIFDEIYTKENFNYRKPNPECYQFIAEKYKNKKIIGFEDSLIGIHALCQVKEIKAFHIKNNNKNYYYNDYIKENYNVTQINNYDVFKF
jgi:beta-phosphoglucomutase